LDALRRDPEIGPRFDEHVRRFGDRWHGELKLETVTPREQPEVLLGVLAQHVLTPPRAASGSETSPLRAAIGRLPLIKRSLIAILARVSRRLIATRENTRFERTRVFGLVRRGFRAIGAGLAARGHLATADDVFYLTKHEIFGFIAGTGVDHDLAGTVRGRRLAVEEWRRQPAPDRFRTSGFLAEMTEEKMTKEKGEALSVLSGIGASAGVVRGRVRLIRSPEELDGACGCIIATESTDPGWSFIFPLISGILVERGSLLSHAAIVAREMGIPAVVGIERLMERMPDGGLVELDGKAGTVRVIEAPDRHGSPALD
jgi:pyruvate,water dikinase